MFGLPFRQLPQRKRRLLAFGVVVCWLMLNTQLALAAHLCDVQPVVQATQVVSHHGMNMTQASHHASVMVKAPLCVNTERRILRKRPPRRCAWMR
ncbi:MULTISPECIES: hypothetical protein [Symbiopectobacterium]|uniref:hypothetical protein n=1 Tax=Symbiopectobacterium TaxID=801 RepID=UPI001A2AFE1C|nr:MULTISPECIES: hypothetical protein [Symbiopectobacterium]MBG6247594.1 hypothetical protein [Candidatus Symbiopectobacterium sp. PLON1]MBT9429711.1 hypothetical protein [Candidatus Symbiopectobacterium endolongispinus]